jgi:hypothetical protein
LNVPSKFLSDRGPILPGLILTGLILSGATPGPMMSLLTGILLPGTVLSVLLVLWVRYGRDYHPSRIVVQYGLPNDPSPAEVLFILTQCRPHKIASPQTLSRLIAATLMQFVSEGIIQITGSGHRAERLVLTGRGRPIRPGFETDFIGCLFGSGKERLLAPRESADLFRKIGRIAVEEAQQFAPGVLTRDSLRITRILDMVSDIGRIVLTGIQEFLATSIASIATDVLIPIGLGASALLVSRFLGDSGTISQTTSAALQVGSIAFTVIGMILIRFHRKLGRFGRGLRRLSDATFMMFTMILLFTVRLAGYLVLGAVLHAVFELSLPLTIGLLASLFLIGGFGRIMPRWQESAHRTVEHVLGLREFIRRADADRITRVSLDAPESFRRTLPYAILMGFGSRWMRLLHRTGIADRASFAFFWNISRYFADLRKDSADLLTMERGESA